MKHQPFETWVFMQDELSPDQQSQLGAHLRTCESCEALADSLRLLETQIAHSPVLGPEPGFTNRWRARLQKQSQRRKNVQTSLLFGGLSAAAAILVIPFVVRAALLILSPEDLLINAADSAFDWLSWVGFIGDIAYSFIRSTIETVPAAWWGMSGLIIIALGAIWFISLNRYSPSMTIERRTRR